MAKRKPPASPQPSSVAIRDRIVELRRVPAHELQANPANWRKHPAEQMSALAGVLSEIGFAGAELCRQLPDGSLMLIDGHARANLMGEQLVPCLVTDLSEGEANTLLATFDPLGAMATADTEKLDALLREVQTGEEAVAKMLEDLAKEAGCAWAKQQEVVEDEVPEAPTDPVTKPGDLWVMGEHRVYCGDSRNVEHIERVMQGDRATCVFTDPPYGVSIGAKNRTLNSVQPSGRNLTDIADDDLTPEQLEESLLQAFINCRTHVMADDCTLFVCSPQGCGLSMMMMMMQNAGLKARHVLIWVKNQPTFSMGRLDYDYQHEPILLTWLKRHKRPMAGTHKTSVWKVDKPRKSAEHPTMKPVELYANAYLNNSDAGDIVTDLYGGSGTAIVAAEQVGRKARVIEISPAYCDVAVQRWEKLTGKKAEVQHGS